MPTIDHHEELQRLMSEIDEMLTSTQHQDEFRHRLCEVPIVEGISRRYVQIVLRMSWKARMAPVYAGRVLALMDQLFE